MEANEVLDLFGKNGSPKVAGPVAGLSVAFFERTESLFWSDIRGARKFAGQWRKALKLGDDPAYVYRAKALGEWAAGRWKESAKSFLEAGRLQADSSWSYALPAVDAYGRAGEISLALQTGEMLQERLKGSTLALARLNINIANVYEQIDDLERARAQYQLSAESLEGVEGLEADLAKALAGQGACAWQLERISESKECCLRARKIFEERGQQVNVDVCDVNLAQCAFQEGDLDLVIQTLRQIAERADGARRPWILELMGFTYRRLNLIPEAVDCFEEALADKAVQRVGRANIEAGLGISILELGQPELARPHVSRAKRFYARTKNRVMPALIDVERAQYELGSGEFKLSKSVAAKASQVLTSEGLESAALLARSISAEAQILRGEGGDVSQLSELLIERGDPTISWRGHYLRAIASGGDRSEFRAMLDGLLESRLMLKSPLSRAAFWGDKKRALNAYLNFLLSTDQREDNQEAFNVVARVRSATLIDEILGSRSGFDEAQLAELAELRSQLNVLGEGSGIPPHLRFSTRAAKVGRAVSRKWHEATRDVLSSVSAPIELQRAPKCAALVGDLGVYKALTPAGEALALGASITSIDRMAANFRFECIEPLIDPSTKSNHCLEALRDLCGSCFKPWATTGLREVCPEDGLWAIPWQAFPLLLGEDEELALRLTPLVSKALWAETERTRLGDVKPKIAVWIGATETLPNIARERDLLLSRFPDAIVCNSRQEVINSMVGESVDLVHVSAHGRHQDGNPMFSYIDFEDGPLYAAEIATMKFWAKRAVLLSCESGKVSIPFRREPDGLARAFLARGAEEIVGSSWMLDDEAALQLFSELYSGPLTESLSLNLAKARRKLREEYVHPFYWAGPVLLKGYGAA